MVNVQNIHTKTGGVYFTFDPQSGHEQKGRRPALVISKTLFNKHMRLAIVCPVTNTCRGIPIHVPIPKDLKLTGFIMVEQVNAFSGCKIRQKLMLVKRNTFML